MLYSKRTRTARCCACEEISGIQGERHRSDAVGLGSGVLDGSDPHRSQVDYSPRLGGQVADRCVSFFHFWSLSSSSSIFKS